MRETRNINRGEKLLESVSALRWELGIDFSDDIVESIQKEAISIADKSISDKSIPHKKRFSFRIDKIVTNRLIGFPIMLLLLALVFWLTIVGANTPSGWLATLLVDTLHPLLKQGAVSLHFPLWLSGILIDGAYLACAWVVAVMLPPMAIFFPMFTLLEDFGYLPRVAFNMDNMFRKVGAHGKQALTMSMGFGCNAAGVIAARVIDSPRERLIAIITNNFALCNGRWPTQILIATIFIGSAAPNYLAGILSAGAVVGVAVLGIFFSLLTSWGLTKTVLRGESSVFALELPPYRPPRIWQTLYTSLIDRTIFVLWRAILFALPAGVLIWAVANIYIGEETIATYLIHNFDSVALIFGLNGVIVLAYIIAIPANEIVIPTILMLTVVSMGISGFGEGAGVMFELNSIRDTENLLRQGGWTLLTAVNLMLFSLLHNPCSTTIYTIFKETRSIKWTLVSTFLPIVIGLVICFFTTQIWLLIAG